MKVTKEIVAQKLVGYLDNQISLSDLVDWAENAVMEADFAEENGNQKVRDVVARLGLADVKAFGLEWEDHKRLLKDLGYQAKVTVRPQP